MPNNPNSLNSTPGGHIQQSNSTQNTRRLEVISISNPQSDHGMAVTASAASSTGGAQHRSLSPTAPLPPLPNHSGNIKGEVPLAMHDQSQPGAVASNNSPSKPDKFIYSTPSSSPLSKYPALMRAEPMKPAFEADTILLPPSLCDFFNVSSQSPNE